VALTNYTTLQTAITNHLKRADLTSHIPDFITLCETTLNQRLRLRWMETRVTASVSTEYVELPTGFLEMRNFQLNTSPKQVLRFVAPEYIDTFWTGSTTGKPAVYTFIGNEIQLAPVPDGTYTAEMTYYKKLDIATDATNLVLTNAPNVYLYGALLAAEPFMKNDKRIGVWKSFFETALADAQTASDRQAHSGGSLTMRADITPV
jgi:hypothetical protein